MRKIVLTYGLIAGAIMSAMLAITLPFQEEIGDSGMIIGYTSMVMAFLMIYFGVRTYRDNVAGGTVSFGRALMVGMAIMAVGTVCYVATWELIFFKSSPEFADRFISQYEESARKNAVAAGKSQAEIDATVAEMRRFGEQYRNPLVNIAYTILEPLPAGLLFALGSAWAVSRRRRVAGTVPA